VCRADSRRLSARMLPTMARYLAICDGGDRPVAYLNHFGRRGTHLGRGSYRSSRYHGSSGCGPQPPSFHCVAPSTAGLTGRGAGAAAATAGLRTQTGQQRGQNDPR
jgi:hypothetical protein